MSNLPRAQLLRGPLPSVHFGNTTYTSTHRGRGCDGGYAPTSTPGVTDAVDDPYQILYLRSLDIPHMVLRLKNVLQ